jgi:phosphonate transport system substrate-binding protein
LLHYNTASLPACYPSSYIHRHASIMRRPSSPLSPYHPGNVYVLAGIFVVCLLLLAGCNKERRAVGSRQNQQARQTLTIGLVTEQDIFKQVHRYEPLAEYLEQRLDMNVRLSVMPSYDKALTTFVENKLDAAFFGSMTYVLAHARLGVEVIARPVALDGASTYYGVIIVRSDSKIYSSGDMKGKRMAFVDKNTMAGYLHPLAYFKKYGIDYRTYFKEFYFAGTHEDVIYDILDRKADVGAVKSTVLARLAEEDPKVANGLFIISRTPPVPENSLAVRPDLKASLKEKIRTVMLNMHEDPDGIKALREFKAKKFIATTDRDFHSLYVYTHDLGIDVHTEHDTTRP